MIIFLKYIGFIKLNPNFDLGGILWILTVSLDFSNINDYSSKIFFDFL